MFHTSKLKAMCDRLTDSRTMDIVIPSWRVALPSPQKWHWFKKYKTKNTAIHSVFKNMLRKQHFCFLPGFTSVDREGRSTLHFQNLTNVTISISTSQIFRSWVAIFQPRPPIASLFRSLYGMPGLAPRMVVLSWGRCDFQISFSNRDTSRNAWNRHWGSFMVDTGILSNNMKFPSHKC